MENDTGDIVVQQVSWGHHGSGERGHGLKLQSLESGADLETQDENQDENQLRPTYLQSNPAQLQIAVLLLYYGANHNIRKNEGEAPLYREIKGECYICGVSFTAFNESLMS